MNNKNFTFFYLKNQSDPAIQPTKPIQNLQIKDETQQRRIPKGRYDTTYRREYLNFNDVCTLLIFLFVYNLNLP